MDREVAENYDAKENEIAARIARRLDGKKISMKDFYPEFELESPYGSSIEPRAPVYALVPFYNRLIVTVGPLRDPESFRAMYGVTVDQLLDLQKQRRVCIRLAARPVRYVGLGYLDHLLEKEPPSGSIRSMWFDSLLAGEDNVVKYRQAGLKLFGGAFSSTDKKIAQVQPELKFYDSPEIRLEKLSIAAYAQLCALGYDDIVERVNTLALANPSAAASELDFYRLLILGPRYYSLDGVHCVDRTVIDETHERIRGLEPPEINVFPSDVGRCLVTELDLVRVKGLNQALEIYPDYEKARDALRELDKAVTAKMSTDQLLDRSHAVEEVWKETASYMSRMERLTKVTELGFGFSVISILGIVGALAADLPAALIGILAALGYVVTSQTVATPIAERIAKLGKPSHVAIVWDIKRAWPENQLVSLEQT